MTQTVIANAKLNLFLDITGIRQDGYHLLNSVMQSINIGDKITVAAGGNPVTQIKITCDNPEIPTDKNNIAYKAATLFLEQIDKTATIEIHIEKHIPVQAGMGGSSADGAGVLVALNNMFGGLLTTEELCEIGIKLGADVPFCIVGGTKKCSGIGEVISPLKALKNCAFVIIQPDFSNNTKKAYFEYDANPLAPSNDFNKIQQAINQSVIDETADNLYNVFQQLYRDKRIEDIADKLVDSGAKNAVLTGSGSAVFGVFADIVSAEKALLKLDYPFVKIASPCENGVVSL